MTLLDGACTHLLWKGMVRWDSDTMTRNHCVLFDIEVSYGHVPSLTLCSMKFILKASTKVLCYIAPISFIKLL